MLEGLWKTKGGKFVKVNQTAKIYLANEIQPDGTIGKCLFYNDQGNVICDKREIFDLSDRQRGEESGFPNIRNAR